MTEFEEELPEECPPSDSNDAQVSGVWRFIRGKKPSQEDFFSHAKLGKPNSRQVPACEFASCSFFEYSMAQSMAKTPFFKKKLACELSIPSKSGKHRSNGRGHVDFWMYAGFDPLSAVVQVLKL